MARLAADGSLLEGARPGTASPGPRQARHYVAANISNMIGSMNKEAIILTVGTLAIAAPPRRESPLRLFEPLLRGLRGQCTRLAAALLSGAVAVSAACAAAPDAVPDAATFEEAYVYALPVFEIARTRYAGTALRPADKSALNRLMHRRTLSTHENRTVTTPNNDTLYSQAFLDLSRSAVEISTPDFAGRYFSIAFMDAFTNNFVTVGRRTTGTRPQHYLVVGPGWKGSAQPGVTLIHAPGNWVWVLVRILIQGPEEYAEVQRLQDAIVLNVVTPFAPEPAIAPTPDDAENFIAVVNQALGLNPPPPADRAVLERIARVGIGPGLSVPDGAVLQSWKTQFPTLRKHLFDTFESLQPPTVHDGWNYRTADLGNFGTDYPFRAIVAIVGLAALEPAEVVYSNAVGDKDGNPLLSDRHYRWRIPPGGLPVDAFWSLTAYEETPQGALYFADNPIHRYAIGDRTRGLLKNPDGSIDVLIQHDPPQGPLAANWLPIPSGPVKLTLRAYQPRAELLDGRYRFPGIEWVR